MIAPPLLESDVTDWSTHPKLKLSAVFFYFLSECRIDCLKWKCLNDRFVDYKHTAFQFTRHFFVDYLTAVWTHSLQRNHWWANYVTQNFSKSVSMKKKLIYILDCLRVSTFSSKLSFLCEFVLQGSNKILYFCLWVAFILNCRQHLNLWIT